MTMIYNTDPDELNISATQGDAIDMTFYVNEVSSLLVDKGYLVSVNSSPAEGTPFAMSNLYLQVRRKDGLLLKDWISGVSPADIVIFPGGFHLFDDQGFLEAGLFDYDLECDNGIGVFTIMRGSFWVRKQITL